MDEGADSDSSVDILISDVKSNAIDLTMDTADNQEKPDAPGGSDVAEMVQQGTCVLVLPVNPPGDATSGTCNADLLILRYLK